MKYPYIGKLKLPLLVQPIELFFSWTYCIVEEDCGDNLHCYLPSEVVVNQLNTGTSFGSSNYVVLKTDVKFVQEIQCSGNEIGEEYRKLIDKTIPVLVKLQQEHWKTETKKLADILNKANEEWKKT